MSARLVSDRPVRGVKEVRAVAVEYGRFRRGHRRRCWRLLFIKEDGTARLWRQKFREEMSARIMVGILSPRG